MSSVMHEWPRRHRINVEHFYRMAEAGLFAEDERLELVNGEIIDMPPMGSRHAGTLEQLASLLSAAVGARAIVRSQLPLRLSDDSEPQPDIVLVVPSGDHYKSNHPTADHVLLLVEISDATLHYDREVKIPLYARHRVPEVWIVDLQAGQIHFYRTPTADEYADLSSAASPGRTAIASLPGLAVDLSPLLG